MHPCAQGLPPSRQKQTIRGRHRSHRSAAGGEEKQVGWGENSAEGKGNDIRWLVGSFLEEVAFVQRPE